MMKASYSLFLAPFHTRQRAHGFTMVEMIVVLVITGIIGGMVAVFISAPVQGYVDSARRAEMTDIADTALRRMSRDLRLALPNSVRVTQVGTVHYLEFIPTSGGGRYRAYRAGPPGDALDFTVADSSFDVLGPMPAFATGDSVVIYNLGIDPYNLGIAPYNLCMAHTNAYDVPATNNRARWVSNTATTVTIAAKKFPCPSPSMRFQVISTPVTYVCAPVAGGAGGTLTRYWGYDITLAQPASIPDLTAANSGILPPNALLATNVGLAGGAGGCSFTYDANVGAQRSFTYDANVGAQRSDLVTMQLTITKNGESVTLYNATHVYNEP